MRRVPAAIGTLVLVAALAIGLSQTAGHNHTPRNAAPTPAEVAAAFAHSPAPLAALHRQANLLLRGGEGAVRSRLRALRGYPAVVNKWASWCPPCRAEFPQFQRAAVSYGTRVAFMGLNSNDVVGDARGFLAQFPVTYPSYQDPSDAIARSLGAGQFFPATIFYDARGAQVYVHQGAYKDARDLDRDIVRYALNA